MNDTARIIINLGAPSRPDTECARKFLYEFLSDRRVIMLPQPLRAALAYYIARKRKHKYAESLKKIFQDGMHPLRKHTESLAKKLTELGGKPVFAAYRYGDNNIVDTIAKLKKSGYKRFVFLPLYPQQTRSTTNSAIRRIEKTLKHKEYKIAKPYFDDPNYISALASTIPSKCQTLLVTFHSVPISHTWGTPYVSQCKRTAELIGQNLGIRDVAVAYQSRMSFGKWLGPSAKEVVQELVNSGRKSICVIAPSFACDCSETTVELGEELKTIFTNAGGEKFFLCHCLNDTDVHARLLLKIFKNLEMKL